jgi:hypothetical protein
VLEEYRNAFAAFVKNRRAGRRLACQNTFRPMVRLRGNAALRSSQNAGIWPELPGFVLNAPLSSAICH